MGRSRQPPQVGADRSRRDALHHHHRREPGGNRHRRTVDEGGPGHLSMSTDVVASVPLDLRAKFGWRAVKSAIMTSLMVAAVILVCVPLIAVVWSVVSRGAAIAFAAFPEFFVKEIP